MHGPRIQRLSQPVDLLTLHARHPEHYPFLLESSGGPQARYDLLLAFPCASLSLDAAGKLHTTGSVAPLGTDFLSNLDRWLASEPTAPAVDLPFQGGWFLFLGYELADQTEPVLKLPQAPMDLPLALAVRCPAAIVHDRVLGHNLLIAEPGHEDLLARMANDAARLGDPVTASVPIRARVREDLPERFLGAVRRVQEYIHAGDVYQVNLSRRWQIRLMEDVAAPDIYGRLRRINPAPFSGLMRWQGACVLSSSPERLVRSRAGLVETRPIAGTHPRLKIEAADQQQARALLNHPKERAEHIMLLDLERNDLGRICEPGTVRVNELMALESYAHVHHIVSNVQGRLRHGIGPGEVIRAVFPGGTITGCPKIRCMQIIAELEGEGRGAYTGAMGYLDRSGALDLNILIRSLVLQGREGLLRTGAGIVADSDPRRELEETRAKALGLLRLFEPDA
jgi:anthranilate synthase component 1